MQMPIRIRNLTHNQHLFRSPLHTLQKVIEEEKLTASGSIFPSSCSTLKILVRGISIMPSRITCETCTPCGPNSRANDCATALSANLPDEKVENSAEPFRLAVAPVKIRVGGWGVFPRALSRRGREPWAK